MYWECIKILFPRQDHLHRQAKHGHFFHSFHPVTGSHNFLPGVNGAAVHVVRQPGMRPFIQPHHESRAFPVSPAPPRTGVRRVAARACILSTPAGISGVSNNSRVKLMKTASKKLSAYGSCAASPLVNSTLWARPARVTFPCATFSIPSERSMPYTLPRHRPPAPGEPGNPRCQSRSPALFRPR